LELNDKNIAIWTQIQKESLENDEKNLKMISILFQSQKNKSQKNIFD